MSAAVLRNPSVLLPIALLTLLVPAAVLIAYVREPRQFRADPPLSAALEGLTLMPNGIGGTPPDVYFALGKPYEKTAYDLSQGMLIWGLMRRRDQPVSDENRTDRRMRNAVIAAVAASVIIITGLTIVSFHTTRGLGPFPMST